MLFVITVEDEHEIPPPLEVEVSEPLSVIVLFVIATGQLQLIPPPEGALLFEMVLPVIVLLTSPVEAGQTQKSPPPLYVAVFLVIVLFFMVIGDEPK